MGRDPTRVQGLLSVVRGDDSLEVTDIGDEVGVYRENTNQGNVHIRKDGDDTDLGFSDVTVSRMREDGPPVRFYEEDDRVYVENADNTSAVTVNYLGRQEVELKAGERERINDECTVNPGYGTTLRVSLEDVSETAGVSVPAYVSHLCESFTERSSKHDALIYGQRLLDVVQENPLDTSEYEEAVEKLEARIEQLRTLDSTELDSERRKYNERAADRIDRLYDRRR
jgi:hypothetical protein